MRKLMTLCALLALATPAAAKAPRAAVPPGARYVAMGSSFAAGAGIGPPKPGTPARCGRTVNNYASLLSARLRLKLDDVTCGGATTAHILGRWNELPPQIDAVNADTRLVTITIGGNDLNYAGNLIMAGCDPTQGMQFQGQTFSCRPLKMPDEAAYAGLETRLREIATQVRSRAPKALLVFVEYVRLVPSKPCPAAGLAPDKAAALQTVGQRLAAITARVARQSGAMLLATDRLSAGHTVCDREPWASGHPTNPPAPSAPWHPTAAGHRAIAAELARMLGKA